jgi:hypothetical protein
VPVLYLLGTGHTCTSTHAFASGLPLLSVALASAAILIMAFFLRQLCLTSPFIPLHRGAGGCCFSKLELLLCQAESGLCLIFVS